MIIDLRRNHPDAQSCEPEFETTIQKQRPNTISRRHTCSTMVRFMSTRNTLFMIPEQPLLEEQLSSSFTDCETPIKPRTRKTPNNKFMSTAQRRKSIVRSSLEAALSIAESAEKQLHSSANSVNTCSTAELTDEESDGSSTENAKREAAALWGAPLLRGNRRWNDKLGEEHFLYSKSHRKRCDRAPVCPSRR